MSLWVPFQSAVLIRAPAVPSSVLPAEPSQAEWSNPDTPWDCHICRSVGVVLGVNGVAYMAVPWSAWSKVEQVAHLMADRSWSSPWVLYSIQTAAHPELKQH